MDFSSLHNYYERLVISQVLHEHKTRQLNLETDELEDVACVALNRLPARYIRHDIDLAFYLTSSEREQVENSITEAVDYAIGYVSQRKKTQTN